MFNYYLALDRGHATYSTPLFLGRLVAPVALDEIRAICSHSRDEALSSKVTSPILGISFDHHYLQWNTKWLTLCPIQRYSSLSNPILRG